MRHRRCPLKARESTRRRSSVRKADPGCSTHSVAQPSAAASVFSGRVISIFKRRHGLGSDIAGEQSVLAPPPHLLCCIVRTRVTAVAQIKVRARARVAAYRCRIWTAGIHSVTKFPAARPKLQAATCMRLNPPHRVHPPERPPPLLPSIRQQTRPSVALQSAS